MRAIGSNVQCVREPDDGRNSRTRVVPVVRAPAADLGTLFVETYATFAPTYREVDSPGIAIVAVEERTRRVAGCAQLKAHPTRHTAAIVGRHDACDLYLEASDELPLRQLAIILDPVASWQRGGPQTEYRILDLRTEHGLLDEHGRALRGLRCDGTAVLRCAGHALFVLPLGDPTDWPESGADAWAIQPERVYFDELLHVPRGSSTCVPNFGSDDVPRTRITAIRGPRETSASLVTDGDLAGTLELVGPSRHDTIQIGNAALRDGVLLGRYARCDRTVVDDESVSRVHALLIQIGEQLVVIDTASTNGTARPDREPERVQAIEQGTELRLGFETWARWRWLS
jgi:hypothetical protein